MMNVTHESPTLVVKSPLIQNNVPRWAPPLAPCVVAWFHLDQLWFRSSWTRIAAAARVALCARSSRTVCRPQWHAGKCEEVCVSSAPLPSFTLV